MKVRSGLIQMALKGDTSVSPEEITKKIDGSIYGKDYDHVYSLIELLNSP